MNVDNTSATLFSSLFQEFLEEVATHLPSHYRVCGDSVLRPTANFFFHELDINFRRYQKFSRQNNFSFILQIGLAMQSILRLPVIVNLCMLTFSPILVFHSKLFINPFLFVGLCNQSFYDVVVSIWHQCHSEDLSYCVRNLCIEYFNVYNLLNILLPALCKSRKLFCFQQGRKQLSRDHICEILVRQGKYFCCLVNC